MHDNLKGALLKATELDTDVIMKTIGFAHRCWLNDPCKKTLELEAKGCTIDEIMPYVSGKSAKKMFETGDLDAGTISISQSVGLVKEIMPVKDIVQEIMKEANEVHQRMTKINI